MDKLCSIVILSYNQMEFTKTCLESIRRNTKCNYEIIVIDNHSNEETLCYLREQKDILLIQNKENKGFAAGCNQGMQIARGDYILLLNNDTIVTEGYLEKMLLLLESDLDIGIVGPLTNNTIGQQKVKVDIAYGEIDKIEQFGRKLSLSNSKAKQVTRLIGFCMLFRRNFLKEVGFFDEGFKIGNYEDDDLCIRALLKKKKLYICTTSFVYHYKRVTFDLNNLPFEDISLKNKLYLEKKWGNINWNHYSVFNNKMLEVILEQKAENVLHIGCGIGSLELEVKQRLKNCKFIGIESHSTRRELAKQFCDEVYSWDSKYEFLSNIQQQMFDVIIIESSIEMGGVLLLEHIKPYMKLSTKLLLRIFNYKHISTVEKIITGQIWGNTISAVSKEFNYYYDQSIKNQLESQFGLDIIEIIEVKKELKDIQKHLFDSLKCYVGYEKEGRVYNRIYLTQLHST